MARSALCILAGLLGLAATGVRAAPVQYEMPPETATLQQGPGVETAAGFCAACHSVDYINTQPRGTGFGKNFWQAEVTKMIKVYGAPIEDSDAKSIVDYLAATYK